jgi:hypothetical protein
MSSVIPNTKAVDLLRSVHFVVHPLRDETYLIEPVGDEIRFDALVRELDSEKLQWDANLLSFRCDLRGLRNFVFWTLPQGYVCQACDGRSSVCFAAGWSCR